MRKIMVLFGAAVIGITGVVLSLVLFLGRGERHPPVWAVPDADIGLGRQVMLQYGCYACHVIPGIREGRGRVGPKLEDIVEQIYIGGVVPNTPENMIGWIQHPQKFSPETAMPDMGVSEREARNGTAYLFNH